MNAGRWWMFLRRDLSWLGVVRMSDAQWTLALDLVRSRSLAPREAAKRIAAA